MTFSIASNILGSILFRRSTTFFIITGSNSKTGLSGIAFHLFSEDLDVTLIAHHILHFILVAPRRPSAASNPISGFYIRSVRKKNLLALSFHLPDLRNP